MSRRAWVRALGVATAGMAGGGAGMLIPALSEAAAPARFDAAAPRLGAGLSLLDDRGQRVELATLLATGAVALNFIYTNCSSFCPPQTAIFRALQEQLLLDQPPLAAQLLSVSIDPLNDSPDALRRYAARFEVQLGAEQRWRMLTGSRAQVDALLAAFGLHGGSLLDHPAQVWLGHAARGRWMRVLGLATPEDLWQWLRAAAA
jgi:protein SCO1/2